MTIDQKREMILKGNIWRVLILLAIPISINSAMRSIFSLFDAFFTSTISSEALAAVSLVDPINQLVNSIGMGITVAGTSLIARYIALKNTEKVKLYLSQLMVLSIVASLVIVVVFTGQAENILKGAGATDAIIDDALIYLTITLMMVPMAFFISLHNSIRSAEGSAMFVVKISLIITFVKLIGNWFFIIHLGEGVVGLGYATFCANLVGVLVAIYFMFIKNSDFKLGFKDFKTNFKVMGVILMVSVPIIVEKSTMSFGHIFMSRFAIEFGEEVLTGYAMTNKINTTAFAAVTGIGAGIVPIVAQNLAVGNIDRVKEAFKKAMILATGLAIILYMIILAVHIPLANIFAKGDSLIYYHTINAVRVYSITVIPWAIFQVTIGMYQGMRLNQYPLIISLLRLWVFRIGLITLLILQFNMNEFAIWNGMLISNTLAMVVALLILKFVGIKSSSNVKEQLS